MVAEQVRLVRQIVRVDADAMSTNQSWPKAQEVPFRAGCLQHLGRIDPDLMTDQGKLVDQRDVKVPLRVFDDLGGLRDLDAARPVHTCDNNARVDPGNLLERFGRIAGDKLDDLRQRMLLVARIDALRRISDKKVAPPLHLGTALDDGHADFFGRPGVDGRFEDDGRATLQVPADRFACRNQGSEVGLVRVVNRGRNCDDDEIGVTEFGRVGGNSQSR